jgi:hypothetical protein
MFHRLALSALFVASIATIEAFSPANLPNTRTHALRMVATTPSDLGLDINQNQKEEDNGAMMDLSGIVFSVR